jgi:tRNA(Glu) U13 pseudouridine synthase TruD
MNQKREQESKYLEEVFLENPALFESPTIIENTEYLRNFGIVIPGKEQLAKGYLKLYPQDFIVEEIMPDGTVCTITREKLIDVSTTIPDSEILHATLVKCNLSTLEAIDELSHILECQKTQIGYAGIKDKDALTAQRISLKGIDREKLKTIQSTHLFLKDIAPAENTVQKGVLQGNRFSIYVRTEPDFFNETHIKHFASNIQKTNTEGFYNFYYLQRFGEGRYNNFQIGVNILKGNFEAAVKDIMTHTTAEELPFMAVIRKNIADRWGKFDEIAAILEPLPMLFKDELLMARYLAENPDRWQATLQQVLDKVGIITYSVASLFFNEYISTRLSTELPIPEKLPLLFSPDRVDMLVYKDFLNALDITPSFLNAIRPFSSVVRLQKRMVNTMDRAEITASEATPHGIVLSFSLGKGEYATTFLAHLFNLVSGKPPAYINTEKIDPKQLLKIEPAESAINYFAPVSPSKADNYFKQQA